MSIDGLLKFSRTVLAPLWFFVLILALTIFLTTGKADSFSAAWDLFSSNRLTASIAAAVLIFLLVERWRRVEQEVADVRKNQHSSLQEIQKSADRLVRERIDSMMRKTQIVESRISTLLDEHPWIAFVSDTDLIPDIPSCQVAIRIATELVEKGKKGLAYEFLFNAFGLVSRKLEDGSMATQPPLQGTAADFERIAEFCETYLRDEYLSVVALQAGYRNSQDSRYLIPRLLRRLLRLKIVGTEASRLARELKVLTQISLWTQFLILLGQKDRFREPSFFFEANCSLSLWEAVVGNPRRSDRALDLARNLAPMLRKSPELQILEAERSIALGNFSDAESCLIKIESSEDSGKASISKELEWLWKSIDSSVNAFKMKLAKDTPDLTMSQEPEKRSVLKNKSSKRGKNLKNNSSGRSSNQQRERNFEMELDARKDQERSPDGLGASVGRGK